ncbi:MAG TPA: tetratricopeptide repeat protein, partial [Rhodospirillaceae bacterium]|nr:tetratricopeptide repeat protein [Rhodospirillaceae bacterium]
AFYRAIAPTASVFWSAQLRVATNLDELGDVEAAAQALEGLLQTRPGWSAALVTLGDLWRTHKHWPEAIQAYDRAISAFPEPDRQQWAIFYSRGVALERNQQWAKAEADFLKALELAPDEPDVLNYLGYSWIEQGINLEQARKMIEKAVRQRPDDGFIVDSLGWAYFRAGDFARAVETIERAVELHPEDPTINDHFGDVLWSVGRRQEARFQWQRALVFNPEPDQKTEIERKLHEGLALSSSHNKAEAVR